VGKAKRSAERRKGEEGTGEGDKQPEVQGAEECEKHGNRNRIEEADDR
jgi:hypothetical protein